MSTIAELKQELVKAKSYLAELEHRKSLKTYKDPRSLANGLLNRIDTDSPQTKLDLSRCTGIAYYLFKWDAKRKTWLRPTDAHREWLMLDALGFTTAMNPTRYTRGHANIIKWVRDGDKSLAKVLPVHAPEGNIGSLCKFETTPTVAEIVERLNTIKRSIDVPVDGLVIQPMLNAPFQKKGDHLARRPFFVRAIKLDQIDQDTVEGVVKMIEWNVSKRGLLKPTIVLKTPIVFGGVEVDRCTGNNARFIVENRIGMGTRVKLIRSGDVIPRVMHVYHDGKWNVVTGVRVLEGGA